MKLYTLHTKILVPIDLDSCFSFFNSPRNLEKLTPKNLSFKILTPGEITMQTGTCIDYQVIVSGIPTRWTSLIQDYEPPHRFTDVQLKGPYSFWHHEHSFHTQEGGTLVEDKVHYGLPLGLLGRLGHSLFIKKQLQGIFDYRKKVLIDLFGS